MRNDFRERAATECYHCGAAGHGFHRHQRTGLAHRAGKEHGARLISDKVQIGAGGHLYFFVHPSSAGGVLLEICQDPVPMQHATQGSEK